MHGMTRGMILAGGVSVLHLLPAAVPGGDPAAPPRYRARRLRPAARSPARAVQEEGALNTTMQEQKQIS